MKRYVRELPVIEILINLEYTLDTVAAAEMNHPTSISKKKKLADYKLVILNDIVESVLSTIRGFGFDITRKHQSKKSYTYYVWFQPISETGEKLVPVQIQFRISGDHVSRTEEDNSQYGSVVVKSIFIGPNEYDNPVSVILAIEEMCKGLQKGDITVLSKFTFAG